MDSRKPENPVLKQVKEMAPTEMKPVHEAACPPVEPTARLCKTLLQCRGRWPGGSQARRLSQVRRQQGPPRSPASHFHDRPRSAPVGSSSRQYVSIHRVSGGIFFASSIIVNGVASGVIVEIILRGDGGTARQ